MTSIGFWFLADPNHKMKGYQMDSTIKLVKFAIVLTAGLLMFACSTPQATPEKGYYFVFLNTNPDRTPLDSAAVMQLQEGHIANIQRLADEKKMIVAGPFYTGGGIFIFQANSIDSVNNWLATDPAIRAGRFKLETMPLVPQIGKLCAVDSVYTMVTYQFTRYLPSDPSLDPLRGVAYKNFVDKLNTDSLLIYAGLFDNDQRDGFLITDIPDSAAAVSRLNGLELVQFGGVTASTKQLWIAKESFCSRRYC